MQVIGKKKIVSEIIFLFVLLFVLIHLAVRSNRYYQTYPQTTQGYHNLAKACLNKGKYREAEAYAKKALALNDRFAKAYIDLGNIYFEMGNYLKAEREFRKALAYIGDDKTNREIIYYNLGVTYKREGDSDKSWHFYRQAYQMKASLGKEFWSDEPSEVSYYVTKNDRDGFVKRLEGLQDLPKELYKRDIQLRLYAFFHQYRKIISTCEQYLRDNPHSRYTYLFLEHLISALIETGNYATATVKLEELKALSLTKVHQEWVEDTQLYNLYAQKKFNEALEYVDFLTKTKGRRYLKTALYWKAAIYKAQGNLKGEAEILQEYLERFPRSRKKDFIHLQLSDIYAKSGDYAQSYSQLIASRLFIPIVVFYLLIVISGAGLLMVVFVIIFEVCFRKRFIEQTTHPTFSRLDLYLFLVALFGIPWITQLFFLFLNYHWTYFFKITAINPLLLANILSYFGLTVACVYLLKKRYKLDNASLGFISRGYKYNVLLPIGVTLASVAVGFLFMLLIAVLGIKLPTSSVEHLLYTMVKKQDFAQFMPFFIGMVVIGPIAEEIIFRVYLFNFFKKYTTEVFALVSSALFFMLLHGSLILGLYFFMIGAMLSVIYIKTRTVIPCIVTHILYNFTVLSFVVLFLFFTSKLSFD